TSSVVNVRVVVGRYTGPGGGGNASPRLKMMILDTGAVTSAEHAGFPAGDVVGPTVFGHGGGPHVVSVGAVPYSSPTTAEPYSSRGPSTLYFGPVTSTTPAAALASMQVIPNPDVVAPDGVRTTFFLPDPGGGSRFFGTSASAPHVAAVAALALQRDPTAS